MVRMNNTDRKGGALAVAIENNKTSQYALKWAVENVVIKCQTIMLVHVRQKPASNPNPSGSLGADVGENDTPAHKQPMDKEAKDFFTPFRVFCQRKNVLCSEFLLEGTDVAKALTDFVANNLIELLVLGAPSRSGLVRRFRTNDIPSAVWKGAPDFCSVYIISKGKMSSMRSATTACSKPCIRNNKNDRTEVKFMRSQHHIAPENTIYPIRPAPDEIEIKSPFTSISRSSLESCYEFSATDSDTSFVSNGRAGSERAFPSFSESSEMTSNTLSNGSECDAMSFDSSFCANKSIDMSHCSLASYRTTGVSSSSWSAQNMDDIEAEMRRLRLELKQTMELYSSACKEALTAKQKVMEAQQWKLQEQIKMEVAGVSEEAAPVLAEKRLAELEAQRRARQQSGQRKKESVITYNEQLRYRRYSIEEIEEATGHFSQFRKIGEGGYGPVYKGHLDHTPVAIKVLRPDAVQGRSQFQQEVEILSRIRHPNMVLLLGACPEYGCLVYEHMENGNLEDRLFRRGNTPALPWPARFRIAAEIGSSLLFLHQTKPEPIVHRDLKPANILLDRNNVSKISDVGLARLVPPSVSDSVTQYRMTSAAGTFCYIDPEYQQTGMLGTKSDIYSLGIMLLQIITSKPPMGITYHVERSIENGTFVEMLDPAVTDWPIEEALHFAKLALQCAQLRRKDRPDLGKDVLPELNRLRTLAEAQESNINVLFAYGHVSISATTTSTSRNTAITQDEFNESQFSGFSTTESRSSTSSSVGRIY